MWRPRQTLGEKKSFIYSCRQSHTETYLRTNIERDKEIDTYRDREAHTDRHTNTI